MDLGEQGVDLLLGVFGPAGCFGADDFGFSRQAVAFRLGGLERLSLFLHDPLQTVDFSRHVLAGKERGLKFADFFQEQIPVFSEGRIREQQLVAKDELNDLVGLPLSAPDACGVLAVGPHVAPDKPEGAVVGQDEVEEEIAGQAQIPFRQGLGEGRAAKYKRAGRFTAE